MLFDGPRLQRELGMGTILVTHGLGVAAGIADWVVMYAGRIVEEAPMADVLRAPVHPDIAGMLVCTAHDRAGDEDVASIPGSPPDLRRLPPGCSFALRCPPAMEAAGKAPPTPSTPRRMARCLRVADMLQPAMGDYA